MKARRRIKGLFIAAGLLVLAALFIAVGQEVKPRSLQQPLSTLSNRLGLWRGVGPDQTLDAETLAVLRPSAYLLRNYADPAGNVCAVFVAFFALQQEGQIIHSPRHCLPGNGWQISQRKTVEVTGPGGPWRVNHLILSRNLEKLSVLYWYQGRGRVEADEYKDRARLVLDSLMHNRSDGSLVRLTMETPQGVPYSLRLQKQLASQLIPALWKVLPPS
jgi:EpsI family protein